jgi:hypothetical protein
VRHAEDRPCSVGEGRSLRGASERIQRLGVENQRSGHAALATERTFAGTGPKSRSISAR